LAPASVRITDAGRLDTSFETPRALGACGALVAPATTGCGVFLRVRICGRIGGVDERAVHGLDRSSAALEVENERLQRMLHARFEEERALRRVATLIAQQHAPEVVLNVVTEEVARHLAADAAMTTRYNGPGHATVVAEWSVRGMARFPGRLSTRDRSGLRVGPCVQNARARQGGLVRRDAGPLCGTGP
jgi:hypothetical protein